METPSERKGRATNPVTCKVVHLGTSGKSCQLYVIEKGDIDRAGVADAGCLRAVPDGGMVWITGLQESEVPMPLGAHSCPGLASGTRAEIEQRLLS